MKKYTKGALIVALFYSLSIACKKTDSGISIHLSEAEQVAALEKSLDSVNANYDNSLTVMSGVNTLTPAQQNELLFYFKAGKATVDIIKKLAKFFNWWLGHKWVVIKYSDGFCIFNRVRNYRTIDDIINTAMGRGGDCDWWSWPESARKFACLRNKTDAKKMVQKHGKIIDIRWIDHPTKNCGK